MNHLLLVLAILPDVSPRQSDGAGEGFHKFKIADSCSLNSRLATFASPRSTKVHGLAVQTCVDILLSILFVSICATGLFPCESLIEGKALEYNLSWLRLV